MGSTVSKKDKEKDDDEIRRKEEMEVLLKKGILGLIDEDAEMNKFGEEDID